MEKLIPINYDNDRQTVLGRTLHEFLEVDTPYTMWFKRMTEYGFVDGVDFITISLESTGGRPSDNHQLSIDMAKEIAMLQRTEKGKQARQYFIELEKKWNSPEFVMARAVKMANTKILQLESNNKEKDEKIKELTPAAEFGNAIKNNDGLILVRDYVKILANAGIKIRQHSLFNWLQGNHYLYRNKHDDYLPYSEYIQQGLFHVIETPVETQFHGSFISFTTKITGKGQEYFLNKLKEAIPCQVQ